MANEEITSREKLEFYKYDLKTLLIYCTIGWTVAVIGFIIMLIDNTLGFILPVTMIPAGIICITPVFRKLNNGASLKAVWVDVETVTTYKDGHKTREADFGGSLGMTLLHLIPVILKAILCVFMLPFIILHRAYMVFKLSKELGEVKGSYKYLGFTGAAMVYFIVGLVLWGSGSLSGLGTGRKVRDDFKDRPEEKVEIIYNIKDFMIHNNHKANTSYYYVEYNSNTKTYSFKVKEGEEVNFDSYYSKVLEAGHVYTVRRGVIKMNKDTIERIRKFTSDRDWDQFHSPANLAKSISIEANELLECFQWFDDKYDLDEVKDELADVLVYCRNLLDKLNLDEDEIVNNKMSKNEAKYPIEKVKGIAEKYTKL